MICMVPKCNVRIGEHHLMCVAHWRQLPKELKDELQKRLHGWSHDAARECLGEYLANPEKWIVGKLG
jgi:hypothetical protein